MSKTEVVEALRVLNLVSGAALAGMMLWEAVIILPIVRRLPPSVGLDSLRFAGARAWRIAPVFGVTTLLSGIALVVLLPWSDLDATAAFTIAGLVWFVTAVLVTFGPYASLDKRVRAQSVDVAAAEQAALLPRLARLHALRTTFYVLALPIFAVASAIQ